MRVPPNGSIPLSHTESSQLNKEVNPAKVAFRSQVPTNSRTATVSKSVAADLIEDVKALAQEVKSGTISQEEASKKFVGLVIEKRHDSASLGSCAKQIEDAVKEIAGGDPHFVSSLNIQLQKLAHS